MTSEYDAQVLESVELAGEPSHRIGRLPSARTQRRNALSSCGI